MTEADSIRQSAEQLAGKISAQIHKLLVQAFVVIFSGVVRDYRARRLKMDRFMQAFEAVLDAPEVGNEAWLAMKAAYEELTAR